MDWCPIEGELKYGNEFSVNLNPQKWVQVPMPMSHHDHNKTPFNGLFLSKFSYGMT